MGQMPKAVRQQEEAADAALESLERVRSEQEAALADMPENATATAANTRDDLLADSHGGTQPAPAQAKPGATTAPTGDDRMEKVEHALSVLQGKYDAEVPRYAARIRELEAENDGLREQVDRANEIKEQLATDPEAAQKYLSPEELEDIDPDALDFQSRLSRGVAETLVERKTRGLVDKVDHIQDEIEKLHQAQSEAIATKFWTNVDRLAPGAADANASQDTGWVAFLSGNDPVSRMSYRDIGVAAVQRGDFEAVANLFNLYRAEEGLDQAPAEERVARQAAPSSVSGGSSSDHAPRVRPVKQSEVRKAYQDFARGKITQERLTELEATFDRAAEEGMILFSG
jgi:hypothetical protein